MFSGLRQPCHFLPHCFDNLKGILVWLAGGLFERQLSTEEIIGYNPYSAKRKMVSEAML